MDRTMSLKTIDKIQIYNNEFINPPSLNRGMHRLYENDRYLEDYIVTQTQSDNNIVLDCIYDLSARIFGFNYYTISGHDSVNVYQNSAATYIYDIAGFSGPVTIPYERIQNIWLKCYSVVVGSDWSEFNVYTNSYESDETTYIYRRGSDEMFDLDWDPKITSFSLIKVPLLRSSTDFQYTIEIIGGSKHSSGYVRIVGVSA